MSNKKLKFKNKFKKIVSAILAFTMFLFSSTVTFTLNDTLAAGNEVKKDALKAYFNDFSPFNQTRIMMNGDNTLNINYWMNVDIKADPLNAGKCAATLNFVIPGKNLSDLKFYVRDRSSISNNFVEYQTAPNLNYLYLDNLNDNVGYEIHLYDGSLASENFVTKAEFVMFNSQPDYHDVPDIVLINSVNQPLYSKDGSDVLYLGCEYIYNSNNDTTQFSLDLPVQVAPFDAQTVKVAFFADADSRSEKEINIDHVLYDYCNTDNRELFFLVDAQWGADSNTKYEAHFYKDSVQPENFLCKAVEIPTS